MPEQPRTPPRALPALPALPGAAGLLVQKQQPGGAAAHAAELARLEEEMHDAMEEEDYDLCDELSEKIHTLEKAAAAPEPAVPARELAPEPAPGPAAAAGAAWDGASGYHGAAGLVTMSALPPGAPPASGQPHPALADARSLLKRKKLRVRPLPHIPPLAGIPPPDAVAKAKAAKKRRQQAVATGSELVGGQRPPQVFVQSPNGNAPTGGRANPRKGSAQVPLSLGSIRSFTEVEASPAGDLSDNFEQSPLTRGSIRNGGQQQHEQQQLLEHTAGKSWQRVRADMAPPVPGSVAPSTHSLPGQSPVSTAWRLVPFASVAKTATRLRRTSRKI